MSENSDTLNSTQENFFMSNISIKSNVESMAILSSSLAEKQKIINDINKKCRIKEKTINAKQGQYEEAKSRLYYQMYEFNSKLPTLRSESQATEEEIESKLDELKELSDSITTKNEKIEKEIILLKQVLSKANSSFSSLEDRENVINKSVENIDSSSGPDSEEVELKEQEENIKDVSQQISKIKDTLIGYEAKHMRQRNMIIELSDKYQQMTNDIENEKLDHIKTTQQIVRNIADAKDASIIQSSNTNNINLLVCEEKINTRKIVNNIKKLNEEINCAKALIKLENEKYESKENAMKKIKEEKKKRYKSWETERNFSRVKNKHNTLQVVNTIQERNNLERKREEIESEISLMNNDEPRLMYNLLKTQQEIRTEEEKKSKLETKENELHAIEEDFDIEENEARIKYESLLTVLDKVLKKIAKKSQEQERLQAYKVKPIEIGTVDVEPPKFRFLNEYRAYRLLNKELRSQVTKQENANKLLYIDVKKTKKDMKATKKMLVSYEQALVIRNIEKERKEKHEEADYSIVSSKLAIQIAQKTVNIDQMKFNIEEKKSIIDKIATAYNMKTNASNTLVVTDRETEEEQKKGRDLIDREYKAKIVIRHLSSFLDDIRDFKQRLSFASSDIIQKGLLENWKESLKELYEDSLPRLF